MSITELGRSTYLPVRHARTGIPLALTTSDLLQLGQSKRDIELRYAYRYIHDL